IEDQGPLWQVVLNGVILPIRPRKKARDYAKIWNYERNESPLKAITRSQAVKLAGGLEPLGNKLAVEWAMRYGNPSIRSKLGELVAQGCERVLVMPLYPQYCAATTATACDEVFRALARLRHQPAVRIAPPYYNDPVYIEAVGSSAGAELSQLAFKPDVILASFHGVPRAYVDNGDPYYAQCAETTRLLRERLNLGESKLVMTFQSRFGRGQWLEPATNRTVRKLAKDGVKNLAVITPGFSADCLETLEEIATALGLRREQVVARLKLIASWERNRATFAKALRKRAQTRRARGRKAIAGMTRAIATGMPRNRAIAKAYDAGATWREIGAHFGITAEAASAAARRDRRRSAKRRKGRRRARLER